MLLCVIHKNIHFHKTKVWLITPEKMEVRNKESRKLKSSTLWWFMLFSLHLRAGKCVQNVLGLFQFLSSGWGDAGWYLWQIEAQWNIIIGEGRWRNNNHSKTRFISIKITQKYTCACNIASHSKDLFHTTQFFKWSNWRLESRWKWMPCAVRGFEIVTIISTSISFTPLLGVLLLPEVMMVLVSLLLKPMEWST